ncbi:aspartate aminotransferase family protein [Mycobacterium sp. CBMA293]|uniref:aminotransferase family protein n=1 Tax=unclassified Mycolicibacterium TaxID=2636767 RepID=UPI0012DFDD45|nr:MULTISPECIES: aminotransferase class III-fold pyridoxal phosphate-dependent enzyme [unclassified Mycolicibacterium]MUL50135.1 aspartate aminotransferase family protein [Mycolicibacterium sp. CBMA 360]MUL62792.1 aspartate aminotransferase family protein [Mycolicibacterium sp. CBMA 335]MUL69602.1 aspartate aminotransferase family protein [Mycolicibacterium sp. CBMA 311]MUL97443.1 aspartate aminotransferase family protein [Mycolicibacterium sp. CBMA 230]MUM05006.1 aspartate aminotransferase fa
MQHHDVVGRALWSAQAHMPSVDGKRTIIVSGRGAYLTTQDGKRLLDATSGLWHANVGHGREEIARAAYEQMAKLETYHVFGQFANLPALELADRVAGLAPVDDAKIFFTSGGSDSIDLACKLARRHWQLQGRTSKRVILSRTNAYHGLHAFGTSIAGIDFNREGYGTESLVPETARVPMLDLVETARVIEELGAENIAAIVAEPIIGTGGVVFPADNYLPGLAELARRNDILFIADEVITGFGRAGRMFASERFGVRPDLITMAKGLTSGYAPLGGVIVASTVWEPYFNSRDAAVLRHGLTYSGHATACAVAMANLDILENEQLLSRAEHLEIVLTKSLQPLSDHPAVQEVRTGDGFLAGVELVSQVPVDAVSRRCIDSGYLVRPLPGNTLQVCPPFIVSEDEVGQIAESIVGALDAELDRVA